MDCKAKVSDISTVVEFDGGYRCSKNVMGCFYREERRGKKRSVAHKDLYECYKEVAQRSGVPIEIIKLSAEDAIATATAEFIASKEAEVVAAEVEATVEEPVPGDPEDEVPVDGVPEDGQIGTA